MERYQQVGATAVIAEIEVDYDALYGEKAHWIGRLLTPHPLLQNKYQQESAPLESRLDLKLARERLNLAGRAGEDQLDETRIQIAHQVSEAVHQTLYYSPGDHHPRTGRLVRPSLGQISSGQRANCYGFTLVTSSLLERIGIEHSIGFANGHAFITIFTGSGEGTAAWLIDSLNPDFNQDMSGLLKPATRLEHVKAQMDKTGRSVATISTDNFAPHLGRSVQELTHDDHWRWLMRRPKVGEVLPKAEATQLMMSVFGMEQGRVALESNLDYRIALAREQWVDAMYGIIGMPGLCPELDPDATVHESILRVTEEACKDENVDTAEITAALDAYFSSFGPTPPENITQLNEACWSLIGRRMQHVLSQHA